MSATSHQHPDGDNDFLTVSQAAAVVGMHPDTVRRWADSKRLKSIRTPGNQRRFRRADVEALLRTEAAS